MKEGKLRKMENDRGKEAEKEEGLIKILKVPVPFQKDILLPLKCNI